MIKLFNKKTMVIYIVAICVFAVLGTAMAGMNIHYSAEFEKAVSKDNDLTQKIVDGLSNVITSLADNLGVDTGNAGKKEEKSVPVYDEATKAILSKKNATLGVMIAAYALMLVSVGMTVGASEYPKYLEGDKYKAKMRRLEKAKKAAEK